MRFSRPPGPLREFTVKRPQWNRAIGVKAVFLNVVCHLWANLRWCCIQTLNPCTENTCTRRTRPGAATASRSCQIIASFSRLCAACSPSGKGTLATACADRTALPCTGKAMSGTRSRQGGGEAEERSCLIRRDLIRAGAKEEDEADSCFLLFLEYFFIFR